MNIPTDEQREQPALLMNIPTELNIDYLFQLPLAQNNNPYLLVSATGLFHPTDQLQYTSCQTERVQLQSLATKPALRLRTSFPTCNAQQNFASTCHQQVAHYGHHASNSEMECAEHQPISTIASENMPCVLKVSRETPCIFYYNCVSVPATQSILFMSGVNANQPSHHSLHHWLLVSPHAYSAHFQVVLTKLCDYAASKLTA